jgi:hypothetical protein
VSDDWNVVVHVDVTSPLTVVQVNAFPTYDLERLVIKKLRTGTQSQIPTSL